MKRSNAIVNLLGVMILVLLVLTGALGWQNASLENTNAELLRDRNKWVVKYQRLEYKLRQADDIEIGSQEHIDFLHEYITEYVDVPVYPELRNFESMYQLRAWNDSWVYSLNGVAGVFKLNGDTNDCDDQVIQWVKDAVNAGYFAGFGIDTERGHLVASVIIGNDYYFIDPSTDEIFEILNNMYWKVD